jgi:ankyrin repeat protein/rhodanese-related sulfurtransferase
MNASTRFLRLTARDAASWLAAHPEALLLDARDAAHHARGHLPGSQRLDGRNHERLLLREDKQRPVFIYCYHGNASQTYAEMFSDFGFNTVVDLIGGWEAWAQAGLQALIDADPDQDALSPQRSLAKTEPLSPALVDWLAAHAYPDVHTPGAHGNTPLMEAAWRGDLATAQALLAQGVSLEATNGDGNNALWLACVSNKPELVTLLAQAGVPIDHLNATGATSLMYASSSSKPGIVRVLLDLGADPFIETQDGFSAMDMAASLECLQLLRAATRAGAPA